MELKTLKALALTSATVFGLAMAGPAYAQTETVTASLATSSAITTTFEEGVDFGEYFINIDGTEQPTLSMDSTTGAITVAGATNSQVIQITAPTSARGEVTVSVPADNTTVQMTPTAVVDFTDPALSLTTVRYLSASESGSWANTSTTAVPITVLTGGTPESVFFAGVITAGDGSTADLSPLDNVDRKR